MKKQWNWYVENEDMLKKVDTLISEYNLKRLDKRSYQDVLSMIEEQEKHLSALKQEILACKAEQSALKAMLHNIKTQVKAGQV